MKIIWIDGTFGSGKSAVANVIRKNLSNAYLLEFDILQNKYKPKFMSDIFGERYPEAKRYLIDALVNEILEINQERKYDYLIIPIALINDYCNEKLINGFEDIESYHFILTATDKILHKRITEQENRDVDLALTYMPNAIKYLNNHYSGAFRIDTSNLSVDNVAEKVVEIVT